MVIVVLQRVYTIIEGANKSLLSLDSIVYKNVNKEVFFQLQDTWKLT